MPEKKEQTPQQKTEQGKAKKKNIKYSAIKKIRQTAHKKLHNVKIESNIKSLIKKLSNAIMLKDKTNVTDLLKKISSSLDKAVKKNVIHRNKASRQKSRLHKKAKTVLAA